MLITFLEVEVKYMLILVVVQLMMIGMFFLFGYLIKVKKMYGLLSGFSMKPEEEQQELIKRGYPQANAKGMTNSGYILLLGLVLELVKVPNAVMISWLVMTIYLFAYLLYISKLDLDRTRKRNVIILVITIIFTTGIIGAAMYTGMSKNELSIVGDELQISGSYGVEWNISEITNVELVEQLPKVQMRTNGYSLGDRLKGRFRLDGLGNGRLFLYLDKPPLIFIEKGDDYIFINSKDETQTQQWFDALKRVVK